MILNIGEIKLDISILNSEFFIIKIAKLTVRWKKTVRQQSILKPLRKNKYFWYLLKQKYIVVKTL